MGGSVVVVPVFLCGGIGKRLWPLSRPEFPKPFLKLGSELSLFQQAILRCQTDLFGSEPIIVGNQQNRNLLGRQLEDIGVRAKVVWEPIGRNSCPAIILACLEALEFHCDPVILVQACDHQIEPEAAFVRSVEDAVPLATEYLCVFGIKADRPDTNFGYVVPGDPINETSPIRAFKVDAFVEKPEAGTASKLFDRGASWNSGNFLMSVKLFLAEVQKWQPEMLALAIQAFRMSKVKANGRFISADQYEAIHPLSVDHGIFQQTDKAAVICVDYRWRDIGTWSAVLDLLEKKDTPAHSGHLQFEEAATALHSDDFETRPWGEFECVARGDGYKVKRLEVAKGRSLSLQSHTHRSEHWVIVRGVAEITLGDSVQQFGPDQSIHVPKGEVHRIKNVGNNPLILIEVQLGDYLEEDDIVRIADEYDRVE